MRFAAIATPTVLLVLACAGLAVAQAPNSGDAARAHFVRGMGALEAGRLDEAREAFREASLTAPSWGLAHLNLGVVQQLLAPEGDEARRSLERAVELAPENPRAHFHLGVALERRGDLRPAISAYRRAIALRPELVDAHFHLAELLRATADPSALAAYEQLLRINRQHTGALLAVAELYERASDLARAEEALLTLTRAQPGIAYNYVRLASFYERTGEARKARDAYSQAESMAPRPKRAMRQLKQR